MTGDDRGMMMMRKSSTHIFTVRSRPPLTSLSATKSTQ